MKKAVRCPACGYTRISYKKVAWCNHNQDEEGLPFPIRQMVDCDAKFCTEPTCDGGLVRGKPKLCDRCNGSGLEP